MLKLRLKWNAFGIRKPRVIICTLPFIDFEASDKFFEPAKMSAWLIGGS